MTRQKRLFFRLCLFFSIIYLGTCSLELPERISVKGAPTLDLPLGAYKYPKEGEKIINIQDLRDSLGDEMAIYDCTDRETQTFLIHYTAALDPIEFDIAEYDFDVQPIDPVEESVEIPLLSDIYESKKIVCKLSVNAEGLTIPGGFSFMLPVSGGGDLSSSQSDLDSSFKSAVFTGYLELEPDLPEEIKILSLSAVTLTLSSGTSPYPPCTISSPIKYGDRYRFSLPESGVTLFPDTEAALSGLAYIETITNYNVGKTISLEVDVNVDHIQLVEVTIAVDEQGTKEIIDLSLPLGVNRITFDRVGALLDIGNLGGCSVDNLKFQVGMGFYTEDKAALEADDDLPPAFYISTEHSFGDSFAGGGDPQYVGWENLTLPPPEEYPGLLSDIKSAKITVTVNPKENGQNRELTLRGISSGMTITISAGGEPSFEIAQAELDLNQFVTEDQRASSFPGKDEQGQDKKGISFSDFTGELGESIDIEDLGFDAINFYVYLNGLGTDIWATAPHLYLAAEDKAEGGSLFPITAEAGDTIESGPGTNGDIALPELDDERGEFSGTITQAHFSTPKLAKILSAKPENLHVDYRFQFGAPYVFVFPEDGIISKTISVDLFIEVPVKLRLYAKPDKAYGALTYKFEEEEDILGRDPEAEDEFSDYTQYLDTASLEIAYENTLGFNGVSLVLLGRDLEDDDRYTFEKILSLHEAGTMLLTLRGDEIPNPFIPMVEIQVPAGLVDDNDTAGDTADDRRYGAIELKRGGSFNAVSIRVKAQTYIEQDFSF